MLRSAAQRGVLCQHLSQSRLLRSAGRFLANHKCFAVIMGGIWTSGRGANQDSDTQTVATHISRYSLATCAVSTHLCCHCVLLMQVTSYRLAMSNAAEAVNGPTLGTHGNYAPFSWEGRWSDISHRGMPAVFDFSFELQKP